MVVGLYALSNALDGFLKGTTSTEAARAAIKKTLDRGYINQTVADSLNKMLSGYNRTSKEPANG